MARPRPHEASDLFDKVTSLGLALPDVERATKYDGSPVLRVGGAFMAGVATHPSAERDTLVVRYAVDERACLLAEAPGIYYLTDYYQKHPVVLVRLRRIDDEALRDVLTVSWRLTLPRRAHTRGRVGRTATTRSNDYHSSAVGPYAPGTGTSSRRR